MMFLVSFPRTTEDNVAMVVEGENPQAVIDHVVQLGLLSDAGSALLQLIPDRFLEASRQLIGRQLSVTELREVFGSALKADTMDGLSDRIFDGEVSIPGESDLGTIRRFVERINERKVQGETCQCPECLHDKALYRLAIRALDRLIPAPRGELN